MSIFDLINSCFEGFGAFSVWFNIAKLKKDRDVKGIVWQFTIVWMIWGYFNPFYYGHLNQWFSLSAGLILAIGNTVWLITWLKIMKQKRVCAQPHSTVQGSLNGGS